MRGSHRPSGRFFLRTGDHFGRTGWIFLSKTKKEGSPSAPLQGRFLFDPVKKQKAFLFAKRNRNVPLVSARNWKMALFWGNGLTGENSDSARLAHFGGRSAERRQWRRSPFYRVSGIGLDLMALWSLYSATNCRKSGKYTAPLFRFFMDFLQIHILAFYGHIRFP